MIVYWCKNNTQSTNKKNKIEETKTLIYPFPDLDTSLNKSNSFDFDELKDSSNQNYSFIEEDSSSVIDIFNEIENNNFSDTKSISTDENKIRIENMLINVLSSNEDNKLNEKQIFNEIENVFSGNISLNEQKIFNLFHLCKEKQNLKELLFQKVILNIVTLINNNKHFYENLFMIISEEEREILINEIIKNIPQLIINKNGYEVILFLISFRKVNIMNNIIYFISQNFVFYCLNDYSSEIICSILSTGMYFSINFLSEQIKKNFELICKNKNGIKIIEMAQKFNC
jgi:hypothetical protein